MSVNDAMGYINSLVGTGISSINVDIEYFYRDRDIISTEYIIAIAFMQAPIDYMTFRLRDKSLTENLRIVEIIKGIVGVSVS